MAACQSLQRARAPPHSWCDTKQNPRPRWTEERTGDRVPCMLCSSEDSSRLEMRLVFWGFVFVFSYILSLLVCATASKFVTSANFINMLCALSFTSLMLPINNPDVREDKSVTPTPVALTRDLSPALNVALCHHLVFMTILPNWHSRDHVTLTLSPNLMIVLK